ncbi:MurR/RpiR family transcriptional regulator [Lacisediminihabitans profunda]
MANPQLAMDKTITELAELCDTSGTSVVRFCRSIGLSGYPELRLAWPSASPRPEPRHTCVARSSRPGPSARPPRSSPAIPVRPSRRWPTATSCSTRALRTVGRRR